MTSSLPSNPSIENLKKQAKSLNKAWQAGDAGALGRIHALHPRYANASAEYLRAAKPRLADCQLVLARESGFDSWRQLKAAVESASSSASQDLPDRFVT